MEQEKEQLLSKFIEVIIIPTKVLIFFLDNVIEEL